MPSARLLTILLASASLVISAAAAAPQGKGPPQDRGEKGQQQAAKHKPAHMNGHNVLGAKLKQNGHPDVGKLGNRTVTADVANGKVNNMAAGDLAAKRVKTNMKMAFEGGVIPVPAGGAGLQFAQYGDTTYYGYCFDDGVNYTCYWYTVEDVNYVDYTWDDYYPYY